MKKRKEKYILEISREQLWAISDACDNASRIYKCIPDTATIFDNILVGRGATNEERKKLLGLLMELRTLLSPSGKVPENDTFNTLYDIHQVLRHQIWKENPNRTNYTTNSSVCQLGKEDLCTVKKL